MRDQGLFGRPVETRRAALAFLVAPEATQKFQYVDGVADVARIDPDDSGHDQPLLDRPGNKDVQRDLFLDYGTNVPLYPKFQTFFRERKPPTLIVWGENDKIFPADGATPYLRDLPARHRVAPDRHRAFRARGQG